MKRYIAYTFLMLFSYNLWAMKSKDSSPKKSIDLKKSTDKSASKSEDLEVVDSLKLINPNKFLTNREIDSLEKKVGPDIFRKIQVHLLHRNEHLAYRHREALLPAIVLKQPWQISTRSELASYRNFCQEAYENFHKTLGATHPYNHRIIISGSSPRDIGKKKNLPVLKDYTDPQALFGKQIEKGDFGVIGWSDGKTQIIINDSDRDMLNNLSYEQMTFIADLYGRKNHILSLKDMFIFRSLPQSMQDTLRHNYPTLRGAYYYNPYVLSGALLCGLLIGYKIKQNPQAALNAVLNVPSTTGQAIKYIGQTVYNTATAVANQTPVNAIIGTGMMGIGGALTLIGIAKIITGR